MALHINCSEEELDTSLLQEEVKLQGVETKQWPTDTLFGCPECREQATSQVWDTATKKRFPDSTVRPLLEDGRRSETHFYVCPACGAFVDGMDTVAQEKEVPVEKDKLVPRQKEKIPTRLGNEEKIWLEFKQAVGGFKYGNVLAYDTLRKKWYAEKGWLMEYFDEDGRIEVEYTEPLTRPEYEQAFHDFLYSRIGENGASNFAVPDSTRLDGLREHVHRTIFQVFSQQEVMENRIIDSPDRIKQDCYRKLAGNGMKLSKYLLKTIKYSRTHGTPVFLREYVQPLSAKAYSEFYEYANMWYSRLTDVLKPSARKVVLSINPLDFITASEHTTGWSSCIAATKGGFRGACASQMLDGVSCIAFVYSRKDSLHGVMHPRKMWRQFVYLDRVHASALTCRQYPQHNLAYEKVIRAITARILSEEAQLPYKWKFREVKGNNLMFEADKHAHMYAGDSMSTRLVVNGGSKPVLRIGETILCFGCGTPLQGKGGFFCDRCAQNPIKCRQCGEPVGYEGDLLEGTHYDDEGGGYYCEECYNDYFTECPGCNERMHVDNMMTLFPTDERMCHECARERGQDCAICGTFVSHDHLHYVEEYDYEVCQSCLDRQFSKCVDCGSFVEEDDVYVDEDTEEVLCERCYDKRQDEREKEAV